MQTETFENQINITELINNVKNVINIFFNLEGMEDYIKDYIFMLDMTYMV